MRSGSLGIPISYTRQARGVQKSMKRIDQFAEGLTILAKYDQDGFSVQAQHDVIYAGPSDANAVSPGDRARLEELSWHINSEFGCWAKFT